MNKELITIACTVSNHGEIIQPFLENLMSTLKRTSDQFEIIFIDNASKDHTATVVKMMQQKYSNIRYLALSRKYDYDITITALLDHSIGDYVIVMDPNMDPPELIPQMIATSKTGFDLVIGERMNPKIDSFINKLSSKLFYKLSGLLTSYKINPNDSDYFLMSRRMINSITQNRSQSRYFKYLRLEVGYKHCKLPYEPVQRGKVSNQRPLIQATGFALEQIITNSDKILRFGALLGFMVSFANLIYVLYILTIVLVRRTVAEGWPSMSLFLSFSFFLLFLFLSVISLYLSSVLKESRKSPLYYIEQETHSSLSYQSDNKLNIV